MGKFGHGENRPNWDWLEFWLEYRVTISRIRENVTLLNLYSTFGPLFFLNHLGFG